MTARRGGARAGRFLVLEGIDGAGTTTQAQALAAELRREGRGVHVTREPSEGAIGTLIRRALIGQHDFAPGAMALLFAADRVDHLSSEIEPALARGEVVLCDRYLLSSLAYQGAQLPIEWVETLNALAVPPDLTLFLEVGAATAANRRAGRGGAAELYDADELQRKIARGYLAAIRRRARQERIVRIDGELPVEEVTSRAMTKIRKILPRRR